MITSFSGMNISSKNPRKVVEFYRDMLEIPVVEDNLNYDGVQFGFAEDIPGFWVWDENK